MATKGAIAKSPRVRLVVLGICFVILSGLKAPPIPHPGLIEAHKFRGKGGIIILDARIGDGPIMPFILDTGANPCAIDPVTAKQLGIEAGASITGRGGAGVFTSSTTAKPLTITLGKEKISCHQTLIIDLSSAAEIVGAKGAAGIIGGIFFHGRIVHVDYDRHILTTYRPEAYTPPRAANVIPLKIDENRAYITARLSVADGPQRVEQSLLVDTGSLDTVDHPMLKQGKSPLRSIQATGVGEGFTGGIGKWSLVEIGPYKFRNMEGVVPFVPIVGGGLLSRFNLTFDYDRRWLQLTPRKPSPKRKGR